MLHKPPPLFVFSRLPAVSILILRVLVFLSFFLNLVTTALHRFVSKKMRTRSCVISFRHLGKLSTKFLSVSVGLPRISSSNQFQFYRVRCCRFSNAKKSKIRNRRRNRGDSVCLCLFVFSAIQRYSRKRLANIFFVLILSIMFSLFVVMLLIVQFHDILLPRRINIEKRKTEKKGGEKRG